MITFIFMVSTAVCAMEWLGNYLAAGAFAHYIKKRGYTPPSREEIRACIQEVIQKKFLRKR